jgi:hypothetical protein
MQLEKDAVKFAYRSVAVLVSAILTVAVTASVVSAPAANSSVRTGLTQVRDSNPSCARVRAVPGYVRAENAKRGTTAWKLRSSAPKTGVAAFANRVSASCGQSVHVFVSTPASTANLTAYRMGYYHGAGARAVFTTRAFRTTRQPAAVVNPVTHMARAPWRSSTSFKIDPRFVTGSYLLKIVDSRGGQTYVPLTVTDPAATVPLVLMSEPMTWQAYNGWGGASAYYGTGHDPALRARVVAFDRPYDHNYGSGTFFDNEYPLLRALEQRGVDLNYVTDVDIHERPWLLRRYNGVLLGSHPEYWSKPMRNGLQAARDAGVNLAFLGANIGYWQVRFLPSALGVDRAMVVYKSADEDPLTATEPGLTTVRWRDAPIGRPESSLIGQEYECFNVKADMVLDHAAWPFAIPAGIVLRDAVLGEYDRVNLGPTPGSLQILATSPLTCQGTPRISNVTYYTALSGAGVFSAGTLGWVCHMNGSCSRGAVSTALARNVLTDTTVRLARGMAAGPLGRTHPSRASVLPPPPQAPGVLSGNADDDDDDDVSDLDDGSVPRL